MLGGIVYKSHNCYWFRSRMCYWGIPTSGKCTFDDEVGHRIDIEE